MDVMQLRRGLMTQMASGVQFVKGTFTVPSSGNLYTLNFGKTINKYFYLIEMDDDSKVALMTSGENVNQCYAVYGMYPPPKINNSSGDVKSYVSCRVNPTSGTAILSFTAANSIDNSSITTNTANIGGSANALYRGYTYNYYIVEVK